MRKYPNHRLEEGGRYFLFKKLAEDDLSILYLRQGLNGKDEILIDPHTLSADHTTDIGLLDASSNGKLIIYSVRRGGQSTSAKPICYFTTPRPATPVVVH